MPSTLMTNFCGGFYQARSPIIAADQAVNVYTETRAGEGERAAKTVTLYGTPGLSLFATVATQITRGSFSQDGLHLTVIGATLYDVNVDAGTATSLGTILDDEEPVSFASNGDGGDQIGIVGGGQLKVLTISTLVLSSAITLPFTGPVMIAFLDGYGLINQVNTATIWFSALEDFTTWDALDFFARSVTSDHIVGIAVSRDRVWCLGTKTTTLYYDSGDADNPFIPYPGTTIQMGLENPWLMGLYNDVLYWVGKSARGERRVVRGTDPQAQEISTPPIDLFLGRCTTLDDAHMLIYEQEGHPFVLITAPSSPDAIQTYGYDVRESQWHARAGWNSTTGVYTRWRARGSMAAEGLIFVGDYENGNIYTLDLDLYADNGTILKRERAAPYLSAENQWLFIDQVELGMQAGVGLSEGQGSAPEVMLEISRDGARTWVSAGVAKIGPLGDYVARAIWRCLGRVRADRLVIRITQTDPVKCVWGPGIWVRATNGTGQL